MEENEKKILVKITPSGTRFPEALYDVEIVDLVQRKDLIVIKNKIMSGEFKGRIIDDQIKFKPNPRSGSKLFRYVNLFVDTSMENEFDLREELIGKKYQV